LTLKEKTTLSSPYYLFQFKNDSTNESEYFIASDNSTEKDRYNRFTVTEKSSPNNLNGEVELAVPGFWTYTIREQASSTNLNPDDSGAIVEVGKVKVIGTATSYIEYPDQEQTYVVYNG
jgi:hypothetical protein